MKATIKDVAELSGCSITTVSQVLNGKGERFSSELRQRIKKVASQLEYRPNQIAVSLVTKQSRTLGLIVPNIHNMFFALLAEEIEQRCRENQYNLVLCNSLDKSSTEQKYIEELISRNVDGILLILATESSDQDLDKIADLARISNLPICLVDRVVDFKQISSVTTDHYLGGYMATEHLIKLGHRRIAFLTGPENDGNSNRRLSGAVEAIKEYGLALEESLVFSGDYNWETGYSMAGAILETKASAIFAFNDWSAYGVSMGLLELGCKIPEDISLVGYDGIKLFNSQTLSLTTVKQPLEQMAKEAVNMLVESIELKKRSIKQIVLEPSLVVSTSSANYPPEGIKRDNK